MKYDTSARVALTFLYRIGPEKGVIHIATGAVDNALWDMYARARQKPLWKLVVDMSPVRFLHPFLRSFISLLLTVSSL